jgi:hypothetical protein
MLAEPVFHDKYLIGNGEGCKHCEGTGRTKGARGPATSRRCKPCKGSGCAPLPAEVIVASTRPRAATAALMLEARDAREAAEVNALRLEVKAKAEAAAKPVETMWISCGVPLLAHLQMDFPGTPRAASAFATLLNALPEIRAALRAVRSEAKDPDTDAAVSAATGDLVENALRALGERL